MPDLSTAWEVSARVSSSGRGLDPRGSAAEEQIVNPAQIFLGKFAGKRRKEAFFGQ